MSRRARIKREVFTGDGPTPEQAAKGDTVRQFVTHVETGTKSMAHISAHSPVERWKRAGRLSDSQIAAIALCEALWATCGISQKLCSTYGERLPAGYDNEWAEAEKLDAQRRLNRIEGYCVPWQWEVFENVCRFGEAAGTAGASLGFNGTERAQAATLMLVRCVADHIAREERL